MHHERFGQCEEEHLHGAAAPLAELGRFLRSRRARVSAADVGLPAVARRRTPGLRREEVAQLARLSAGWYTQLEQGRDVRPSPAALGAIARALKLDVTEQRHLFRLAHVQDRRAPDFVVPSARPVFAADVMPSPAGPDGTPHTLRRLLDGFVPLPALVMDRYWDVVGRNASIEVLLPALAPARTTPEEPPRNVVHYVLTNALWRKSVGDWGAVARAAVGGLRASLGQLPAVRSDDPRAAALVAQLERESPEFRAWWREHELWGAERPLVQVHQHPTAGAIEVEAMLMDPRLAPGLTLVTYVPCDTQSAAKLRALADAHAARSAECRGASALANGCSSEA